MTRSVEGLRHESEGNRAELAFTPEHVKSEVSENVSLRGWFDRLKSQAMDNPMQAVAAGTAVAVPLLRFARGVPLPLMMIGAGLVLTSKTARDRAAEVVVDLEDRLSAARMQAISVANDARDTTSGIAGDLRARAEQATSAISDKLSSGGNAIKDTAGAASGRARDLIGDHVLVGGLGIAMGAILAAALPETRAEAMAMGKAMNRVKQTASEAAQSAFEAAKDATRSVADAAANSVGGDLGGHAMAQNMAGTIQDAGTTAASSSPPAKRWEYND